MDATEATSRYARGDSIKRIVRESGESAHRLYALLPKSTRRVSPISESQREAILESYAEPVRSIARRLGVSKSSVHRIRQQHDAACDEGSSDESLQGFVELRKPWRCAVHGWVSVWPCVACASQAGSAPVRRITLDWDDEYHALMRLRARLACVWTRARRKRLTVVLRQLALIDSDARESLATLHDADSSEIPQLSQRLEQIIRSL